MLKHEYLPQAMFIRPCIQLQSCHSIGSYLDPLRHTETVLGPLARCRKYSRWEFRECVLFLKGSKRTRVLRRHEIRRTHRVLRTVHLDAWGGFVHQYLTAQTSQPSESLRLLLLLLPEGSKHQYDEDSAKTFQLPSIAFQVPPNKDHNSESRWFFM